MGSRAASFSSIGVAAMGLLKVRYRGQNLVEYALVIAVVSAAAVAMSTYVYRAVQSKQKQMGEEFQQE
jgi:Flp pilus assembly pilin Flp